MSLPDIRSPLGVPTGHQESDRAPHDHDMNDDEVRKEKLILLDFFTEPGRSYRANRCSLAEARAWRQFYDYSTLNELWPAFGIRDNPIGWIYKLMENGQAPPPLQHPLPGGAVDLTEFTSRGKTAAEIEADHPAADVGAHLNQDGFWS